MLDDLVEQRREPCPLVVHLHNGPALLAAGVEVRKVELLIGGADGGEEIEGVIENPVGIGVWPIDLVEHHDRLETQLQRLAEDELGLGHDPLFGVHQQQAAINHAEDSLDFAAEVGVTWGVDDVDPRLAGRAVPKHRSGLGQDGDASLALLVVGIHRPFRVRFVGAEDPGLSQHLVDEGGFAMIDVGDDGDVAQRHGGRRLLFREQAGF